MLERFAALVQDAMGAEGARVVVEGSVASSGSVREQPVLSAPISGDVKTIGYVAVGRRREGTYRPQHVALLSRLGSLLSGMVGTGAMIRKWRRLALTDELTGLPNRRQLLDRLSFILSEAGRRRQPVTLLLFDVDDFKSYNDEFGHAAGDEILRVTSRLFVEHCREDDIVARVGGDEFAVVFWDPQGPRVAGSQHPDCALDVLQRIREGLASQKVSMVGPTGQGRLTISGGLATFPWDARDRDDLVRVADQALLSAKRAGKDRIFLIGDA